MGTKLDLKQFLSDPAHQASRDFINGVIDARVDERIKAAKNKAKDKGDDAVVNLFDALFGGIGKDDDDDKDEE
jgi:hypothetical protein